MRNRVQSSVYAGRQERAEREQSQQYERTRRVTANRRMYQTTAWAALRRAQLEAYPHCQVPGCARPAAVVDHRAPHHGDNTLFHDAANLQSMCKRCHDRKTVRHDGGFGRARSAPKPDVDEKNGFGLF